MKRIAVGTNECIQPPVVGAIIANDSLNDRPPHYVLLPTHFAHFSAVKDCVKYILLILN